MAVLKERLFAVPDGEIYPRWFEVGEVVSGDVEKAAIDQGKVQTRKPRKQSKALARAPENKATG